MAMSFKQFAIDEDHIVSVGSLNGSTEVPTGDDWCTELNDQFTEEFESLLLSPEVGYRRLYDLMTTYNLALPLFAYPIDPVEGEHIYLIDGVDAQWFLYTAYFQLETGQYEFYAEIMDEPSLNDLLILTDEGTALDT